MAGITRTATKRLMRELETWRVEAVEETGIERLGPVSDENMQLWEAVINGRDVGFGYDDGRWLLRIEIPDTYPLQPPKISFVTSVVHANVALDTGEICLDLLSTAWTPAYSVLESIRAIRMLLSTPEVTSPLNVDVAKLLQMGDDVAARALVELWCSEEHGYYSGP